MSRSVGIASLIWGASILLSRLIGVVREAVIGRTLGSGGEADVYWAAFVLPDFLNYLLAGGALSLVFIPLYQAHLTKGDEAGANQTFSVVANALGMTVVALTLALYLAAPVLAPLVAPGLSAEQRVELVHLIRILLPAQVFHLLGGLVSATLQARDRHALAAGAPLIYTGCIIIGGLVLAPILGAEGFAWGVLVGSVLGPFGLPLIGAFKAGLRWSAGFSFRHPDLKTYVVRTLPVMLGFSIVVVDDWFHKRLGSSVGEGVISQLQYARTLMKVPMGVFGMAAGVAAFPTISRLVAQGDRAGAYATLTRALRLTLLLAFLAQAALTVAGADAAAVIWGTQRFSPEALVQVGELTALSCLGLWAWSAQALLSRGFYAQGDTWTPVTLGTAVSVVGYPCYAWLAHQYGGYGLAIASSCAICVYVAALAIRLQRQLGAGAAGPGLVDALVRMGGAAAVGVAVGLAARVGLEGLPPWLRGGLVATVSVAVSLGAAWGLRVPEVGLIGRRVWGRLRRR